MGDESQSSSRVSAWEVQSTELVNRTAIFDLITRRCRHPERGTEADFYVLCTRDWVNVLPITTDYKVILVKQWRFGVEKMSWEIPGGIMENGEEPEIAGLRELEEETGYTAGQTRSLGAISPNPAILNNTCHFVLALGVEPKGAMDWDEHEEIEVKAFDIDEVYAMAHRGEILHALVLNALFRFYPEWLKIRKRRRR